MANTGISEKTAAGYDTPERIEIAKIIADEYGNILRKQIKKLLISDAEQDW
ncbi:hypothetical protein [Desemzia sp. RIT 804]|uniref:hypothetical protein n=1 Tax=Desemzia sp. RIT 804 TaxID=2810209 RepID=UPI001F1F765F|nr:hypothetical protein [Desemzia sp. RIT 804]